MMPQLQNQPQQINEQKYTAILSELCSGIFSQSYWSRKSRMQILEWEMTAAEFKILEFDIAFKFSHAKDLARSAKKIFHDDQGNEKVRQRIGQLISILMNTPDRKFSTELVSELGMELLQEMFFYAFPEQRHSTKGTLQVYLVCASNQPHSLGSIATKLFANYLGACAEFQRGSKTKDESATPMDAVLFYLFDSLVQANFGDLSIHNTSQIFQILLRNCFTDTIGRLSEDFYSQSGIPCLSAISRPSQCWHFCLPVLGHLYQQRGLSNLAKSLEPFPSTTADLTVTIENALANTTAGPELLKNAEFVRLALLWAMASPLRSAQLEPISQLVLVPANIYWVDPSGMAHFWVYNLDAEEDEDSPAEIEEPQREKKLKICPDLLQPIRLLNALYSAGQLAEQEFSATNLFSILPNAHSIVLLALMASENWKKAAEFVQQLDSVPLSDPQRTIVRLNQLQIMIALRRLGPAFRLAIDLLRQFARPALSSPSSSLSPPFPAVLVSDHANWVQLSDPSHLCLFIQLLIFHIAWLGFVRFQSTKIAGEKADFLFLLLLLVVQSCWEQFGFGLFEQLVEHVANKDRFHCPALLSLLSNPLMLGQLLSNEHVLMDLSSSSDQPPSFLPPSQIWQQIIDKQQKLADGHKSAFAVLDTFLEENSGKIAEILAKF